MTEALLTLVTEGMTQLPVTQKPPAPMRRKFGTSACSKYSGSPPSMSSMKILRAIMSGSPITRTAPALGGQSRASLLTPRWRSWSPEPFDIVTATQHCAVWIGRTARLQGNQIGKLLQKARKFRKSDSSLADLEVFVFLAAIVMQVNVLQTRAKSLDTGLDAAVDIGMTRIQGADHRGLSNAVDQPEMIGERGEHLVGAQLHVFHADTYPTVGGHRGTA